MTDFTVARRNMVASQVRANDVTDLRIQEAMGEIPRELFVPRAVRSIAYMSEILPLGNGRALMEPRNFAKLVHAVHIRPADVVLVIGAGTGYGAAVIARLAETVVALEEDEALAKEADGLLAQVGADNAAIVKGPLVQGYPSQAPYDVIVVEGCVEQLPDALLAQLKEGGRLGVFVLENGVGKARIFTRTAKAVSGRTVFDGMAPLLPGFARAREFIF
jgi:protein-L-isoaspartate(D-aspartate) O-methyltransferase